jgi:Zn-dependent protease with chaperone function
MEGPGRNLEASAVTAIVPMLIMVPFWLLALLVVWFPVGLLSDVGYWWFPAIWALLGLTLFVRPVQVAVMTPLYGAVPPSEAEYAKLQPIWNELLRRIGLRDDHYLLRILPSDDLNAFACGGHLVVVTSFAVTELSDEELAGVLAHELSHHLGFHTVALTFGHWLSIPVVSVARIGFFLQNVARAATDSFASHSRVLTVVGRITAKLLTAVSWVFLAALYASDAATNLVSRSSEYTADRRAIEMGYGAQLATALRRVIGLRGSDRSTGWRSRLEVSHPPALTRVSLIEAHLRRNPHRPHRSVPPGHGRQ